MPELALQPGVRRQTQQDVRQCIGQNHRAVGLEHLRAKEQVGQRRRHENQSRQAIEKVQHRVDVAQPLAQRQAAPEQGVVDAEDLRHATCPADALTDVRRQALGGQPGGLRDAKIGGVVALATHLQRGVSVLGDGLDGDAADFHQRRTPDHRTTAAEERGVPQVVAVLHQPVEQFGFVGHDAEGLQVALDRIGRVEEMRRLQHGQLLVTQEGAHRQLQERSRGHMVAVEDRDELAVGARQCGVEVAGLGVQVVAAGEVASPAGQAELLEIIATAVIEQIDPQLVGRPVHRLGRQHGATHDI